MFNVNQQKGRLLKFCVEVHKVSSEGGGKI